jgi:hypothetical protein
MSLAIDESLLESVARCLDAESVRALRELQLSEPARSRLDSLAQDANEGRLSEEEAAEYDRFIELGDLIASLCLKAGRYAELHPANG